MQSGQNSGLRRFRPIFFLLFGAVLIALGTVGLRKCVSILALFGIRSADPNAFMGILATWLIGGGSIAFISGFVLALAGTRKSRALWLFWSGVTLLCLGSGPLICAVLAAKLGLTADPTPNPVVQGIIAMLTFIPALVLILFGAIARLRAKPVKGRQMRP